MAIASLLLAGGWLLWRASTDSAGAPGPKSVAATPSSHAELARRLFDEACAWVANGEAPIAQVRDVTWALDAKLDLEGTRHEGPLRVWLQMPDLYRRELSMSNHRTTTVLNRDDVHQRDDASPFRHMNRIEDGAKVQQARDDMERWRELITIVTLEGLKGPGVSFEYLGEKNPAGNFAPAGGRTWAKIALRAPGRPDIYLWLAHTKDEHGVMHATFPGVVRVQGDLLGVIPTEDFLLQDWREHVSGQSHSRRRPSRVIAFQFRPGEQPLNFLTAIVTELKINSGIDATRFEPK